MKLSVLNTKLPTIVAGLIGLFFYGFCTLLFYALQKSARNRPLVGAS